jgi:diguanylate cyclase (GGDEF)-like protein
LVLNGAGANESRRELLSAWAERCHLEGMDTAPCTGPDALFLVSALGSALRRGMQTPELGRAARSWGARFCAPVEALAALSSLREVLLEAIREQVASYHDGGSAGTERTAFDAPPGSATVNRVVDQLMLEAVDAASANLRAQARTDPLTGCANRLALHEDLLHAASSAARSGLDLALAVVDLDGLKKINDTEGHAAGDAALKALVTRLRAGLRDADTLYRTGGDEFVVVAPFTDVAGAAAMLQRARETEGPRFSWGVSSMRAIGHAAVEDPQLILIAADTDLYVRRRRARRIAEVPPVAESGAITVLAGSRVATLRRAREALVSVGAAAAAAAVGLAGTVAGSARRWRIGLASVAGVAAVVVAAVLGFASVVGDGAFTAGRATVQGNFPDLGTVPGAGANGGLGSGTNGSGANGSGANGSGANGSGANGSGANAAPGISGSQPSGATNGTGNSGAATLQGAPGGPTSTNATIANVVGENASRGGVSALRASASGSPEFQAPSPSSAGTSRFDVWLLRNGAGEQDDAPNGNLRQAGHEIGPPSPMANASTPRGKTTAAGTISAPTAGEGAVAGGEGGGVGEGGGEGGGEGANAVAGTGAGAGTHPHGVFGSASVNSSAFSASHVPVTTPQGTQAPSPGYIRHADGGTTAWQQQGAQSQPGLPVLSIGRTNGNSANTPDHSQDASPGAAGRSRRG